METPINLELLWDVATSGRAGYLAIFEEGGYSYVSRGLDLDYINGGLCSNPLNSNIFFHAPEDVFSKWAGCSSFSEFRLKMNVSTAIGDRAKTTKKWANIFNYNGHGQWISHGVEGIYDYRTSRRLDDIDGYHLVSLDVILLNDNSGAKLYQAIEQELGKQYLTNPRIRLKATGSATRLVGISHDHLIAVIVPEVYENLVKSAHLFNTL